MKTGIYGFISCMIGGIVMYFSLKQDYKESMKEYQIEVKSYQIYLYDHNRLVGKCNYFGTQLDSLIINDNQ